jgi:hypothetical protein
MLLLQCIRLEFTTLVFLNLKKRLLEILLSNALNISCSYAMLLQSGVPVTALRRRILHLIHGMIFNLNTEFDKIKHYFEEGRLLKLNSPAGELEQALYARWELKYKPQPFILEGSIFELAGKKHKLPSSDNPVLGFFSWNNAHQSAALMLEASESEQTFLLRFRNGEAFTSAHSARLLDEESVSQGEQLEIIYDIISHLRNADSRSEILGLSKKEFIAGLEAVAEHHNPQTVRSMKRLTLQQIKELLRMASADMASDELSDQLSLGLDGNYAAGNDEHDIIVSPPVDVPAKTRWTVMRELNFLEKACVLTAESERAFVITFNAAEVVGPASGIDLPLKLNVPPYARLAQGDILHVKIRGERSTVATFKIDIFDGDVVFGRLRSDFGASATSYFPRLYGLPPRSPSDFIATSIKILSSFVQSADNDRLSDGLEFSLGLKPFTFMSNVPEKVPESLDQSQRRAWSAAINPLNPVVLVQGPPGTGKTYVLEQVLRELCSQGLRVLAAAPSNTAIDNICRRLTDFPVLRFGNNINSIAPDVAERCWVGEREAVDRFVAGRKKLRGGIYAGTNVGLLRDQIVIDDMKLNGQYDVIVFDEAGMSNLAEFLLCANFGRKVVLFGDHQQLPPYPMPETVHRQLEEEFKSVPRHLRTAVSGSAIEYLAHQRGIPVIMLQHSYRCQNPRLLRFASTLFYGAGVKTSYSADYYRLAYHEREIRYPASSMQMYSTSGLPESLRSEQLCFDGSKPGLANKTEAQICATLFYQAAAKYPLEEISIIAPYRKQVALLREILSPERLGQRVSPERWRNFLFTRIATVDSFQGGESDVVIICYVRSNKHAGIGFIDNPNRINVAHTRCRREMHIVGDLECLKRQARSKIFERLGRAFQRDGEIISVTPEMLEKIQRT